MQFVGDPLGSGGSYFVKAKQDNWWYEGGSEFVTDYAMTNPFDDFADTFTALVLGEDFHRNGNDTPTAPQGKLAIIQAWLDSLS